MFAFICLSCFICLSPNAVMLHKLLFGAFPFDVYAEEDGRMQAIVHRILEVRLFIGMSSAAFTCCIL